MCQLCQVACCQVPDTKSLLLPSCPLPSCLLQSARAIRARLELFKILEISSQRPLKSVLFFGLRLILLGWQNDDILQLTNSIALLPVSPPLDMFWIFGVFDLFIYLIDNLLQNKMSIHFPGISLLYLNYPQLHQVQAGAIVNHVRGLLDKWDEQGHLVTIFQR